MVSIELNHDENKFCFNHPISPTSVIGGGDGGLFFFLQTQFLSLSHHDLKGSIEIIYKGRDQ